MWALQDLLPPKQERRREPEGERGREGRRKRSGEGEGEAIVFFLEPSFRSNVLLLPYVTGHSNWCAWVWYHAVGDYTGCEKQEAAVFGTILKAGYNTHLHASVNRNILARFCNYLLSEFSPERYKWEGTSSSQRLSTTAQSPFLAR